MAVAQDGIFNRGEIIKRGLELAGNPQIFTEAGHFLNGFLDQLYAAHDWPFLRVSTTFTSSGANIDLTTIADLRRGAVANIRLNDTPNFLVERDHTQLERRSLQEAESGNTAEPEVYAVNPNGTSVLLVPTPATSVSGTLWYFRQPDPIAIGVGGDPLIPDWPDSQSLVQAIATFSKQYDSEIIETRIFEQMRDKMVQAVAANIDTRGRSNAIQLEMEPSVFFDLGINF